MNLKINFKNTCISCAIFTCLAAPSLLLANSAAKAAELANQKMWSDFVCKEGYVLDYAGEIPSPEDCEEGRPNYLAWWGPTENAPKFTGLYLAAACQRYKMSRLPADAQKARTLVKGLMLCASVSDVKGFVSRGVSTDGKTHYPLGSEDQTLPWIYGMYVYAKSEIPTPQERQSVVNKISEVCQALQGKDWKCPADGKFTGEYRGTLDDFRYFQAPCLLFCMRAMYDLTNEKIWLERYNSALNERDSKTGRTRREICAKGYRLDDDWLQNIDRSYLWIYAKCQAVQRILYELETDEGVKADYLKGLRANAKESAKIISDYNNFDNLADNSDFAYANWKTIHKWKKQDTIDQAQDLALWQNSNSPKGKRKSYERHRMTMPLAAAAISAYSGDPQYKALVESAVAHYDYSKIKLGEMFYAELAYYALFLGDIKD